MTDVRTRVIDDLAAESEDLDAVVADLGEAAWATTTPAPGWTVAHQIAHLAWTDKIAALAIAEPESFRARLQAASTFAHLVDDTAAEGAAAAPAEILARWRDARTALEDRLRHHPDGERIVWFGPPMSAASMATARMMETWAHGLDVVEALEVRHRPTERMRHVAHLGIRTRDYAYAVHGLEPPSADFRVELTGPAGDLWTWGPDDAAQRVIGPAYDFCLLVTRRRHRADLDLTATGEDADRWLDIAQAFAGPPGSGRAPSGRKREAGRG